MTLATDTTLGTVPSESKRRLWHQRFRNAPVTVLELVWIVSELTSDDDEVIATVSDMIRSGAVQLRARPAGNSMSRARTRPAC